MRAKTPTAELLEPTIPVTGLQALPANLAALRSATPIGPVLSVYLDTSPTRVIAGGHLLALRAGAKRLRAAGGDTIGREFEEAITQVETYLNQTKRFDHPAWACFASSDGGFFYATPLPFTVPDDVIWAEKPELSQLEQALDELERVAVLFFDSEEGTIYSLYLGEIERMATFSDYVPPKHHGGGWLALGEGKQARHREVKMMLHVEHTVRELLRELRSQPFDRLIVAGPDEATSLLIQHLPSVLRTRLAGVTRIDSRSTPDEIRKIALTIAEQAERDAEAHEIQQLFDAATTGRATLGTESVLAALSDRRASRLIIASDFTASGAHCLSCDRLMLESQCPVCGGVTTPVEDLREAIVSAARNTGASIEFVSGQGGERLTAAGGLGAWTRFAAPQA